MQATDTSSPDGDGHEIENYEPPAMDPQLDENQHLEEEINNKESPPSPKPFSAQLSEYIKSSDFKELVGSVCLGIFLLFVGYAADEPRQRPIPKQQLADGTFIINLMYDNAMEGDTVPDWVLLIIVAIACPLLQFVLSLFQGERRDFHRTLCVYVLALPSNDLITWLLKAYTGYFRPQFYEGCVPNETYEYCLDPNDDELDVRVSFPSGHASFAFASLTLLYLYLERSFGVSSIEKACVAAPTSNNDGGNARIRLEYSRPPTVYRLLSILCTAPLMFAGFTAASRVADNRHHPADVVTGSVIGFAIAYFYHSCWFQDPRFSSA